MADLAGRVAVLTVVGLLLSAGSVGALNGDELGQVDVETDSTSLNVDMQADGTATWEVVYRIRLDDQNTTEAFENLSQDIDANPSAYLGPFRQRMERTVNASEEATDREMTVENVSIETRRDSQLQVEYGLLVYRLEWTNFAAVDGTTVSAGDAIDRFFLDSGTSLQFTGPEGYTVESVRPDADRTSRRAVQWEGQLDFDSEQPRAVFVPASETPDGGTTATPDESDGGGFPIVGILGFVALALAGGAWLVTRRNGQAGDDSGDTPAASEGDDGDGDGGDATDGPPPELLSNEERVLRLLTDNGGRMKQKELAEQLDWTAAKTSQVVGDLRDEGELDSFRLGRENVLTLPDVDIESGQSDDE